MFLSLKRVIRTTKKTIRTIDISDKVECSNNDFEHGAKA